MNPRLKELLETLRAKQAEQDLLLAKQEPLSEEEAARVKALEAELSSLEADIAQAKEFADIEQKAAQRRALVTVPVTSLPHPSGNPDAPAAKAWALPRMGKARYFKDDPHGTPDWRSAEEKAYGFGCWIAATLGKSRRAAQWCDDNGIGYKAQQEAVNEDGGFIVAPQFEQTLIDLRETYGVFRQYANNWPMGTDQLFIPRREGGVTAYWVAEGASITESDPAWGQVGLVAKKLAANSRMSSELSEDAFINVGDHTANEIAYAFSISEDDAGWNGDGTDTHGGITGVLVKLLNLSATRANIAGLVVGSGNLWSELDLVDFHAVIGRLPVYARNNRARWFCSAPFYHTVMERLMFEAGGVTAAEVRAGALTPNFLGFPVVLSQKMPMVEANDAIPVVLGVLDMAAAFGDRRMTTIRFSEHIYFNSDQIGIRGTERLDINVHDLGNVSATASLRVPGPVVGLATAAS
jgi:HK97 family phage major capsid protein